MSNLRHERVRELLKRAIGEAIRREFHVNDVGVITVNDLDVGGDLRTAIVFISILGNDQQKKHGLIELEKNRIRLEPANSSMKPIYVKNAKLLGVVVGVVRQVE